MYKIKKKQKNIEICCCFFKWITVFSYPLCFLSFDLKPWICITWRETQWLVDFTMLKEVISSIQLNLNLYLLKAYVLLLFFVLIIINIILARRKKWKKKEKKGSNIIHCIDLYMEAASWESVVIIKSECVL